MPKLSTNYKLPTTNFKVKRAFTLIELLTVITIIGILVSIGFASYSSAQTRSRDSRRKTDLDAIKKALELTKTDTPGQYFYPGCNPSAVNCNITGTNTTPALSPTYIQTAPTDPKTSSGYRYVPTPASCTNNCTSYTLIACLENGNDQTGITDATNCPTAPQKSYTITPN